MGCQLKSKSSKKSIRKKNAAIILCHILYYIIGTYII